MHTNKCNKFNSRNEGKKKHTLKSFFKPVPSFIVVQLACRSCLAAQAAIVRLPETQAEDEKKDNEKLQAVKNIQRNANSKARRYAHFVPGGLRIVFRRLCRKLPLQALNTLVGLLANCEYRWRCCLVLIMLMHVCQPMNAPDSSGTARRVSTRCTSLLLRRKHALSIAE